MKIYLAGIQRHFALCEEFKPKYLLESFAYIKQQMFEKLVFEDFLLDSGAFTFLSGAGANINWTDYLKKYAEFIKRNQIKKFFELDIYKIIGVRETENLRDRLQQSVGSRSIPVWHRSLGKNYLHRLSEEYSYIGFGGFAIKDISASEYKYIPRLLQICAKNNCRVHGLGFTNQQHLRGNCKFYSVDSTTWNGARFGKIYIFDKDRILHIPRRAGMKTKQSVIRHNFKQWVKFQHWADIYL